MDEKAAIDEAYAATLATLYKNMFSSYLTAGGNASARKSADESFSKGLALAREVQKRAKELLA